MSGFRVIKDGGFHWRCWKSLVWGTTGAALSKSYPDRMSADADVRHLRKWGV